MGCANHLFNLDMTKIVSDNPQLNVAVCDIKATMAQCKKLKNAAALRKLTYLKAEMDNIRHFDQVRIRRSSHDYGSVNN